MSSSTSSTPSPPPAHRLNPKAQEFCPRFIVAPPMQVPSPELDSGSVITHTSIGSLSPPPPAPTARFIAAPPMQVPSPGLESVITHTSIRSLSPPPPAPTARYEADTRRIQRLQDWQLGLNTDNDDEGDVPRLYKVLSPVETWSDTHRMHDYSCQGCQAEYRAFLAKTFGEYEYEYCINCIYEARQKYVQKMRAEYKYRPRQRRLLDAFKTQDLVEEVADFALGDEDEDDEYFIIAAARYVGTEEDMKEFVAWIAALQAQAVAEESGDDDEDVVEKDSPPTSPDTSPALATVGTLPPPSSPVASYFGDFLNACLNDVAAEPAGVPGWPEPLPAALANPWPPF